jgi:hypothetical protein
MKRIDSTLVQLVLTICLILFIVLVLGSVPTGYTEAQVADQTQQSIGKWYNYSFNTYHRIQRQRRSV